MFSALLVSLLRQDSVLPPGQKDEGDPGHLVHVLPHNSLHYVTGECTFTFNFVFVFLCFIPVWDIFISKNASFQKTLSRHISQ